jgi:dienelactone hydrolase
VTYFKSTRPWAAASAAGVAASAVAAVLLAAMVDGPALAAPQAPAAAAGDYARSNSDRVGVKVSMVAIPVSAGGKTWATAGELRVPTGPTTLAAPLRRPAVVIVHGSGGVDSRGDWYARRLNQAGFATLEIDLWAARGISGPEGRPKSPTETLPDAFAALAYLSSRDDIDPGRIGLMGFSWGGVVSMLAATARVQDALGSPSKAFAAFAPFYPVCWAYNLRPEWEFQKLTGKPVFIQAGAEDRYDDPDSCDRLQRSLPDAAKAVVTVTTYPGATHAWDRREPDVVVNDPSAYKGKGGPTPFSYNPDVTRRSTDAVVAFFGKTLAAQP